MLLCFCTLQHSASAVYKREVERVSKNMSNNPSEIHEPSKIFKPSTPKCRKSIKSNPAMKDRHRRDESPKPRKRNKLSDNKQENIQYQSIEKSENEISHDEDTDYDENLYERKTGFIPESVDFSSNKSKVSSMRKKGSHTSESTNTYYKYYYKYLLLVIIIVVIFILKNGSTEKIEEKLDKEIGNIKTQFYNQEPGIWNEIESSIMEMKLRNPQVPSIILLFANESDSFTMDCLAKKIAHASSTFLGTDNHLLLNPEDFGNDLGEIIHTLNEKVPTKKTVLIRDVLNIPAETVKALHNLCDRYTPLIREAIYIITMQTTNYKSSQKKMVFVEKQIYHKLSKNIDEDTLRALITRITDGVIISVQPELNLRYCE